MPGEPKKLLKLELEVGPHDLQWSLAEVRDGGDVKLADGKDPCEALLRDGPAKETIRLLVALQRWLGDSLAEQQMPDEQLKLLNTDLSQLPQILGQNLYAALFPDKVDRVINDTLGGLQEAEDLLRIQLQFSGEDSELASWPWEYLFVPPGKDHQFGGQFLATVAQLVLSRRLELNTRHLPRLLTDERVKVLLVCAAPIKSGVIYQTVLAKAEALSDSQAIELIPLVDIPALEAPLNADPKVRWESFVDLVKLHEPHVIHFIGHGKLDHRQGKLAFVDRSGGPDWRGGNEFATAITASKKLKLVFLQACESAMPDPHSPMSDVARLCAQANVPAVVAMQAKIENAVAGEFACSFYDSLAQGRPVDYAVAQGRRAILQKLKQRPTAFGVPVLYLRSFDGLMPPPKPPEKERAHGAGAASGPTTQRYCPCCWTAAFAKDQVLCSECYAPLACGKCGRFFDTQRADKKALRRCIWCGEPIAIPLERSGGDGIAKESGASKPDSPGGPGARPQGPETGPANLPTTPQDALRVRTSQRPQGDSNPKQFQRPDPPPPNPPDP
jgi:hypothetical protein